MAASSHKAVSPTALEIWVSAATFTNYLSQFPGELAAASASALAASPGTFMEVASFLKPHEPASTSFTLASCSFSPLSLHRIEDSEGPALGWALASGNMVAGVLCPDH